LRYAGVVLRPCLVAIGVSLSATAAAAQSRTTILVEFTADGQCSIAVRGEASPAARAEMSYRPQAPGRCAIPALRGDGQVALTVLLPRGAEPPRHSRPPLAWSVHEGRPTGVADLPSPPAFVDVMPASDTGVRQAWAWLFLAAAAALGAWAVARSVWPLSGRNASKVT
jgi:hypothetical protein